MERHPIKDAVCEAIKEVGIKMECLDKLLETFASWGVETLEDVEHVTAEDLQKACDIKKVPAKKFLKKLTEAHERERERSDEVGTLEHGPQHTPTDQELKVTTAASSQSQKADQLSSQKEAEIKQEIKDSSHCVAVAGCTVGGDLNVNNATSQDNDMDNILKDTENYIPTPALDAALEHLETNSCLTLTGCPGSGKTTLAHMVLQKLSMKGFEARKLETLKTCSFHAHKYVFLVDDVFGNVGFDEMFFKQWKYLLKSLLNKLSSKRVKLIFTTRLSILKEARPYLDTIKLMFEEKDVLNVTEEKYMTPDTMKQMLRHHTRHFSKLSEEKIYNIVEEFDVKVAVHGFPHCCELLKTCEKAQTNPERFFRTPTKFMKLTLSAIMKGNKTINELFKTMVSSHGEIDLETFEAKDPESFNESLQNMTGTFLKQKETVVAFRHPFLYECVSSVIGRTDPIFILTNAKISYLTYHVVVKEGDEGGEDDTVRMTVKLARHIDILRDRFVSEIKEQNFTMVFQHPLWRNKDFVSKSFDKVIKDDCMQSLLFYGGTKQSAFHWFARSRSNCLYLEAFSRAWHISEDLKLDAIYGCLVWSNVDGLHSILSNEPTNMIRRKFDGKSVLSHVASVGSYKMCSYLVEEQLIDPTQEDPNGTTALHWAAAAGNTDALTVFLKAGCDINAKNIGDVTPLHFAVMYEHQKIVKLLVQNSDCDVNICSSMVEGIDARSREVYIDHSFTFEGITDGTPLIYACLCDNPAIVKILLNAQADALKENPIGQTPFHFACSYDNAKCLRLLVKKYRQDTAVSKWIFAKSEDTNAQQIKRVRNIHISERTQYLKEIMKDFVPFPFEMALRQGNWKAVCIFLSLKPKLQRLVDTLKNHPETLILDNVDLQKPLFDGFRIEHLAALSSNVSLMEDLLKYNNTNINEPSSTGWTPFHLALTIGNLDMTKLLLDNGADVKRQSPLKIPSLFLAVKKGTVELVQRLLDKGADVHETSPSGETPLFLAVAYGLHEIVDLLINKGAIVDGENDVLSTPLHVACRIGNKKCVETLIKRKADLNALSYEGMTPLLVATFADNQDIVSLLIKGGADINAKAELLKFTALHQASSYGYFDIAKQLFEAGANSEIEDEYGYTSLCKVAESGHESILNLHFDHQANLYHQTNEKETPLMLTIKNDHSTAAKLFIEKSKQLDPDSSFNLSDSDGFTALHYACDRGHIDITQALLCLKGINIDSLSAIEGTPLMVASKHGFFPIVQLLLIAKANVNLTTDYGISPLYLACKNGHLDVVKILVETEADVNINHIERKTPLMVACEKGNQSIVEYLLKHGGNVSLHDTIGYTALHWACASSARNGSASDKPSVPNQEEDGDQNIIDLLIQYGAEVNKECDSEMPVSENNKRMFGSPLTLASAGGLVHNVRSLLRNGASPNQGKFVPLYSAARHGHATIVDILIKAGADVNVKVDYAEGRSALIIASMFGHDRVVDLLVKANSHMDCIDTKGRTSLHWACSGNRVGVVCQLLQTGLDENVQNKDAMAVLDVNMSDNKSKSEFVPRKGNGEGEKSLKLPSDGEGETRLDMNIEDSEGDAAPDQNSRDSEKKGTALDQNSHGGGGATTLDLNSHDGEGDAGPDLNSHGREGATTLDLMSQGGKRDTTNDMKIRGDKLVHLMNIQDDKGRTALLTSVEHEHLEIVRLFAGSGADFNLHDFEGVTPLHAAAKCGNRDIVQILVENGAFIDAILFDGQTPLSIAAECGHIEVVQILLQQESDVNMVDFRGFSALSRAVYSNRVDVVLLLQGIVDPEILYSAFDSSKSDEMTAILSMALK